MTDSEKQRLPAHVAIIMDGNGRWAKLRDLPRVDGHMEGIASVREIVTTTRELNIPYLTLYAFSKENWTRPRGEVGRLMELLGIYLDKELPLMLERDIRFNVLGEMGDFSRKLQTKLTAVMKETERNSSLFLSLALSYSSRREIMGAVKSIAEDVRRGAVKRVDERLFRRRLYTDAMPDPDLLIRTSGEMRLSNFLLFQLAYTEIYVTETLWPDFRRDAYMEALKDYARRERRFGKVKGT
jgi:undecaprenyl diphosphate synthase